MQGINMPFHCYLPDMGKVLDRGHFCPSAGRSLAVPEALSHITFIPQGYKGSA